MKAKHHPTAEPRGVRDPLACMNQSSGDLVWIRTAPGIRHLDHQPEIWCDRPAKFPGHVRLLLRHPTGVVLEDVKWRQVGSETWWRLPDWPDGVARREEE